MPRLHLPRLLLLFLVLNACASRTQESFLISIEQQKELGAEFHAQITQEMPVYNGDPQVSQYVRTLGDTIVPHTDRPDLGYTFTVLESEQVNAFAIIGGYVYVTTGLLRAATSGAEVASVVGHELAHISSRHSTRSIETYVIAQGIGALLGEERYGELASALLQAGTGLAFSKDQEREADEYGVVYTLDAGINPWGLVDFFEYLQNLQPEGESGGVFSQLGELFSTHPPTPERIDDVSNQLDSLDVAPDQPNLLWEISTPFADIKQLLGPAP